MSVSLRKPGAHRVPEREENLTLITVDRAVPGEPDVLLVCEGDRTFAVSLLGSCPAYVGLNRLPWPPAPLLVLSMPLSDIHRIGWGPDMLVCDCTDGLHLDARPLRELRNDS